VESPTALVLHVSSLYRFVLSLNKQIVYHHRLVTELSQSYDGKPGIDFLHLSIILTVFRDAS